MDHDKQQKTGSIENFQYDDKIVRLFTLATLGWGLIAFIAGLFIALQLGAHKLGWDLPWLSFGRLRPLHTNAAIFAFAGNAIFAGIYYSAQRLLKTRLWNDTVSKLHFWGWQLIIVSAALTLPFGISSGKEYAELEWPIDLLITVVWVLFGLNLIQTVRIRREKHIYVAIWFYLATFVTVAILHVVNSVAIPVTLFQSYTVYAGVTDALVQWWYGHNAVAFFLTTPFLGLMYYYIPKSVNRPVFSYRLSVIHFWTLVFIYIWAGPHHLLNTALPDWAQTVGVVFSVMLWIPSWGGMINGILTLRGAWDKLRTDPPVKFMIAACTFYGMSTFEGPLLSIKAVSALGHYTDWIIAHVHGGALGWNGFLAFGMIYYMVPRLWKTKPLDVPMMNLHFWTATLGIMIYMVSMWAAGVTQGLMWMGIDESTGKLLYPDFVQTVTKIVPLYWFRALGGFLYLFGFLVMLLNVKKAICESKQENLEDAKDSYPRFQPLKEGLFSPGFTHERLEAMPMVMTVLAVVGILVGSLIELTPFLTANQYADSIYKNATTKPYSPLAQAGRDIYVREGCYTCHSQMIRKLDFDVLRYGPPSTMEESMWDHPFQWGSKRTGPDLARLGGKYPHLWHFRHMRNPQEVVAQSIMPAYPWLYKNKINYEILPDKLAVLKKLGVPYSAQEVAFAVAYAKAEAEGIAKEIRENGESKVDPDKEIIALIAYLQFLGKQTQGDVKAGAK
jgi:cytochrome c oxidase cbb3-type subunit I/II